MSEVIKAVEELGVKIKSQTDAFEQKFADEVKNINEDMAKKGATLDEIAKEVNELKVKAGKISAQQEKEASVYTKDIIAKAFGEGFDRIKMIGEGSPFDFRTKDVGSMTAAANLTGDVVTTPMGGGPALRGRRKVHFRDLVQTISSATGRFSFYRQNAAAGEGSFNNTQAQGTAKEQLDYDLTEVIVTPKFLAGYVKFAKEMAQDLPFLQSFIAGELVEDYLRTESSKFFTALSSAATGSTTAGGTAYAEKCIQWIHNLLATDYDPTHIVTTAAKHADLLLTKPADFSVPFGVTITADGTVAIMGVPVVISNNIASTKTIVGDFSKAKIIQAEGLSVRMFEEDGDNVVTNRITARAEARVESCTLRPDAFIYA